MMRRALLALLPLAACAADGRKPEPRLTLAPCQLGAPGSPGRIAARCGAMRVLEDRANEGGRSFDLRIAIVPAVSRNPARDPLFFLTGGPGQAATETYPALAPAFRKVNRDRDVVLVDQRGTGGSNALRCPDEEVTDLSLLDEAVIDPWVSRCLSRLPGDPRFYTTSLAMADLDEVREALGYERVNLYGLSYGTRAALTYLRLFPERVRAVILDGVVPPTETLGLDVAADAQRAIDLVIARCASDSRCHQAFPEPAKDLESVLERLETPVEVTLRHPRTGATETLSFSREMAAYAIRLLSYSQETASLVPLLLSSAARSDLAPLAAQFLIVTTQVSETIAEGMGISVVCSEDFPFLEKDAIAERNRGTYLGALQTDSLALVCPRWPRGDIPPDFKAPVDSAAPVLLLSGEADPVTPPENGTLTASQLGPNALHLVARGQGHIVIHRGCMSDLVAGFIASGSFQEIDTSCVGRIAPQPFFLDYTGPAP
ncbi:MAG TPA: alpha/beta hydrolase [Vicinamibacteria bacterium]|nr:alpha/beta hydrolase [Vicinamibacteria bacterium]